MLLRVIGDSLIRIDDESRNTEEEILYAEMNAEFIYVEELPYSVSNYYKYDADGITIIVDEAKELEFLKNEKMDSVFYKFEDIMFNGSFTTSLGFEVDNRRGGGKDDKDNVQSLIDLGQEPVYFRDCEGEFHSLDTEQLITLKQEMIQDGLGKYQWKWGKEAAIMGAASIEELEAITI